MKYKTLEERIVHITQTLAASESLWPVERMQLLLAVSKSGLSLIGFTFYMYIGDAFVVEYVSDMNAVAYYIATAAVFLLGGSIFAPLGLTGMAHWTDVKSRSWLYRKLVTNACENVKQETELAKLNAQTAQAFTRAEQIAKNPHLDIALFEVTELEMSEGPTFAKLKDIAITAADAEARGDQKLIAKCRRKAEELLKTATDEALEGHLKRQEANKQRDLDV